MKAQKENIPIKQLEDFFRIKHGYAFKGEFFAEDGPYIVLTPGNFNEKGGFKLKSKEKYYIGDVPKDFILSKNDLIVAMTEQAEGLLGSSALIPESNYFLHNQRLGLIIELDESKLNKRFLYYLFNTEGVRAQIRATANGAKVRHTSPSRIYEVKFPLLPIDSQFKIASILSAYDDLIENNLKRIKILEEMAQMIYREWFVNFRFPGYEKVKMVDSPLGKIPEGWEVKKIRNAFTTVLGGTPARNQPDYWTDGNIPWINSGKINELRISEESELVTELGLKRSSTKLMPMKTTVIAITGATLGQVSLIEIEACANQSVVGIYDKQSVYNEFIYLKFCEIINELIMRAGGGAQQHINKEIVNEKRIVIPSAQIAKDFNSFVRPLFDLIASLLFKNKNLRKTRDLLLPKLISGELDVENMDIRVGVSDK